MPHRASNQPLRNHKVLQFRDGICSIDWSVVVVRLVYINTGASRLRARRHACALDIDTPRERET